MSTVKQNSFLAWFLASRPKTLVGALLPVLLGSSMAYNDKTFNLTIACLCGLFACGMQIAANFINDWYDFSKGSDREDRLGPERACAQGWITLSAMKIGTSVAICLSCAIGLTVLWFTHDNLTFKGWELIAIGMICVVFCFLYTTTLSYRGLGDLLVLIFFGFVPVCGTYYVQTSVITPDILVLSLISGLSTETMLIINNYRDREQDRVSGKKTLVVRFGEQVGSMLFLFSGASAALLSIFFIFTGKISLPWFIVSSGIYMLLHIITWKQMVKIRYGRNLNKILGRNSRNMLILGILLSLAIIL